MEAARLLHRRHFCFSSVVFDPGNPQMSVNMKCLCWGSPLYCQQGVCLVLHSSHSSDSLTTVQVLSFAVVQERFFFLSFFLFVFECVSSSLPMQVFVGAGLC